MVLAIFLSINLLVGQQPLIKPISITLVDLKGSPSDWGTNGYGLTTDGSGQLSWTNLQAAITDVVTLTDGTDPHILKAVAETGLGGRFTIGLDETTRTLVVCDYGDIDDDLALAAQAEPALYVFSADKSTFVRLQGGGTTQFLSNNTFGITSYYAHTYLFAVDIDAGHAFSLKGENLTDTNAEQAWLYIEPEITQTDTANYVGLLMDVTETSMGSGTNELMALRVDTVDKITVDNKGYIKAGTLSASLADNDTFATTIPDSWTGIVIVSNITDTTSGVYHLDGTTITAINQNAGFTTTQGTNDKINVYIAGNVLTSENTWAAAKIVKVMFIGT